MLFQRTDREIADYPSDPSLSSRAADSGCRERIYGVGIRSGEWPVRFASSWALNQGVGTLLVADMLGTYLLIDVGSELKAVVEVEY